MNKYQTSAILAVAVLAGAGCSSSRDLENTEEQMVVNDYAGVPGDSEVDYSGLTYTSKSDKLIAARSHHFNTVAQARREHIRSPKENDDLVVYDQFTNNPGAPEIINSSRLADTDFVARFHRANLREIELGRMAQERGNSPWIKSLGSRLVMDHEFTDRRLMNLARAVELNLPEAPSLPLRPSAIGNESYPEALALLKLSGPEFDREFLRLQKNLHEDTMQMLESARAQLPGDSRLLAFVNNQMPILAQHWRVAENIQTKYIDTNI